MFQGYFIQAELALAAYATLSTGNPSKAALIGVGMADFQAQLFADKWKVIEQYTPTEVVPVYDNFGFIVDYIEQYNGLSVTVFEEIATGQRHVAIRGTEVTDIGDLTADGGILLHGIPDLSDQYQSLKSKIEAWQANGVLSGTFTVAGHSLGGWLAEGLAVDFAPSVEHTYVYNSPGVFGAGFGNLLQQINDALGTSFFSVPSLANLTNIRASAGNFLIAGLGQPLSPPIGVVTEDQTLSDVPEPAGARNHSQRVLTDSLAVYALIAELSSTLTVESIGTILNTSGNRNAMTLEDVVNALGDLFNAGIEVTGVDDRDGLYKRMQAIQDSAGYQLAVQARDFVTVQPLNNLSSSTITAQAQLDTPYGLAYRYALINLVPYVITGDGAIYDGHNINGELDLYDPIADTGVLTDQYLKDRAKMLSWKMQFDSGTHDIDDPIVPRLDKPYGEDWDSWEIKGDWDFIDNSVTIDGQPLKVSIDGVDLTNFANHKIIFGSQNNDALTGDELNDNLYGGAGVDTLTGGEGNDYLEGGAGIDTYLINPGDGYDTVLDSDGSGVINIGGLEAKGSGTTGLDLTKWIHAAGTDAWVDQVNDISYSKSVVGGETQLLIHKGDANVLVKGWSENELGIVLGEGTPPELPTVSETLTGESGNEYISDRVYPSSGEYTVSYEGIDYYIGGNGLLTGTLIQGGGGNDVVNGDSGNDAIYADRVLPDLAAYITASADGAGSGSRGPWLAGGLGDDAVVGGNGNDFLFGGGGKDLIVGGLGNDVINADDNMIAMSFTTSYVTTESDPWDTAWHHAYVTGSSREVGEADTVYAGAGDDIVHGLFGNDILMGEGGDDAISGGGGSDIIYGGDGNDSLTGEDNQSPGGDGLGTPDYGNDYIDGDAGDDFIQGEGGSDILLGGAGNDTIYGESGYFSLDASQEGDDMLFGGAGDDQLFGEGGNNILDGGEGADYLAGGLGNDTYLDVAGEDTIFDDEGDNTVILATATGPGEAGLDVTVETSTGGEQYMQLQLSLNTGETLRLDSPFWGNSTTIQFANGEALDLEMLVGATLTTSLNLQLGDGGGRLYGGAGGDFLWGGYGNDTLVGHIGNDQLVGNDGNDILLGGEGNDKLYGESGDDVLDGEAGNDALYGGMGNDIYLFGKGDGQDTIERGYSTAVSDFNTLEFKPSVAPSEIGLRSVWGSELMFSIAGTTDQVVVGDFLYGPDNEPGSVYNPIQQVKFGDGTVWDLSVVLAKLFAGTAERDQLEGTSSADIIHGQAGDDIIFGNGGDDILDGGEGNDRLRGDRGNDTFLFGRGDGEDLIEFDSSTNGPAEFDVLQFKAGVAPNEVELMSVWGNDLIFSISGTTDKVAILNFLPDDDPASIYRTIDQVKFSDGTTWDSPALLAKIYGGSTADDRIQGTWAADTINGQGGNDNLLGRGGDDMLIGGEGNDNVYGDNGDDTLGGGTGDDYLSGGAGRDTYLFGIGDGQDIITSDYADPVASKFNALQFKAGVTPNEIDITRSGSTLNFSIAGSTDQVTIQNFLLNDDPNNIYNPLQQVQFGDGTIWDVAAIMSNLQGNRAPTVSAALPDQAAFQGSAFSFTLPAGAFTDPDTGDTLNYTATLVDGSPLPSWLSFDADTGTLSGTPDTVGTIGVRVTARDSGNLTASDIFDITISDQQNLTLNGTSGADTLAGGSANDSLNGLAGKDMLSGYGGNDSMAGGPGDDTLDGGAGADTMIGGAGDDMYFVDEPADKLTEKANQGIDTVNSSVTFTLGSNLENLIVTGTSVINGTGNILANLIRGNVANNILKGGSGNDVLEGGAGNDTLVDTSGMTLFSGGVGADSLTGGTGNELFIGGAGNDTINASTGADIVVFNRGDGVDTVKGGTGTDNTVSLGGGIRYGDLQFRKSSNDLILDAGSSESILFKNWYVTTANNKSASKLQVILEASADYSSASNDAMFNNKIEQFDFAGLVAQFDQKRSSTPGLTSWALANALASFHLSGSDTEAMGGDLAYQYGKFGNLSDVGLTAAQSILSDASFGAAPQALKPLASLQEGVVRLM